MLAVRPTRLLAAERAKLDHVRRPNATNEILRKGRFQTPQSPRGGCVLRDPSVLLRARQPGLDPTGRPRLAATHHYELGPNASAQIYSPAQRLAPTHSYDALRRQLDFLGSPAATHGRSNAITRQRFTRWRASP